MTSNADDWSKLWGASATSVPGHDRSRPLVDAWWRGEFATLKSCSRALEVGAGGGAVVSVLAAETFPRAQVIASDFRTDPPAPLPRISYVCGGTMEALPFANESFDLVTGQFAIEYAKPVEAACEIARVARKGGVALFLIHHADSFFAKNLPARGQCLAAGLRLQRAIQTTDEFVRKLRIRQALKSIDSLLGDPVAPSDVVGDLREFAAIGRARLSGDRDEREAILSLCPAALRLVGAQTAATRTGDQMAELMNIFHEAGLVGQCAVLQGKRRPLAWTVRLSRAA